MASPLQTLASLSSGKSGQVANLAFVNARWNGRELSSETFPVGLDVTIRRITDAVAPFYEQLGSVMVNPKLYCGEKELSPNQTLSECKFLPGKQYNLRYEATHEEFFGQ